MRLTPDSEVVQARYALVDKVFGDDLVDHLAAAAIAAMEWIFQVSVFLNRTHEIGRISHAPNHRAWSLGQQRRGGITKIERTPLTASNPFGDFFRCARPLLES